MWIDTLEFDSQQKEAALERRLDSLEAKNKEQEEEKIKRLHQTVPPAREPPIEKRLPFATPDRKPNQDRHQQREREAKEDEYKPPTNGWNINPDTINQKYEAEEPTQEEENKMESTIRTFEKKRDMDELADNPTPAQIAIFYGALAHSANSSGIPMGPIHRRTNSSANRPDT